MDLHERIKSYDNEKQNEILITIDGNKFTEQDYNYIQQLPPIINDSGEPGEFELGNLKLKINSLETTEHNLIKNEN